MKPPSGPKKQTQFKPNFFKGQNERKIGCIHISKKYNVLIGRFWVVKQTLL